MPLKGLNPSVPPPTPSCVEGASPRAADTLPALCHISFPGVMGWSKGSGFLWLTSSIPFNCVMWFFLHALLYVRKICGILFSLLIPCDGFKAQRVHCGQNKHALPWSGVKNSMKVSGCVSVTKNLYLSIETVFLKGKEGKRQCLKQATTFKGNYFYSL